MSEREKFAPVVMSLGYNEYVLTMEDAVTVAHILARAERYKEKYRPSAASTVHVWENDGETMASFKLITQGHYRMAKAAGKPED